MDFNLMHKDGAESAPAARLHQQSGRDEHSLLADAQFVDPSKGDYRVKSSSPALRLGFVNFPMDRFGVQKPSLRAIARMPVVPRASATAGALALRDTAPRVWLGARVRSIADTAEMSAFGLPSLAGVLVLAIPAGSTLAKIGLKKNDVILSINEAKIVDVATLLKQASALTTGPSLYIGISRQQKESVLNLKP
jgi:hypothetical protein